MVRGWTVPELLWQASYAVREQAALLDGVGEREISLSLSSLRPSEQKTRAAVAGCPEMG